jgi:hypothetical protein
MKRRAEVKLHTCTLEKISPQVAGENWVTVADDGDGESVEAYNPLEEGVSHCRGGVGVAEGDEVGILRETVHHYQNHGLAMHLRKALDKIHGDIRPHLIRHLQRLKEAGRLCSRRLVLLTDVAGTDEVLDKLSVAGDVEISTKMHESLLNPLMPSRVSKGHYLVA